MLRTVLLADGDQEVLLTLKEGLGNALEAFTISIAGDGLIAAEKLRNEPICLVVADLGMARMDGFELIAHVSRNYPDISAIAITDHDSTQTRDRALNAGAIACLAKPFPVEQLVRLIKEALKNTSDGGLLHGISPGMFLQLIEMELKTCTIRMLDKDSGKQGVLFFKEGILLDARSEGIRGMEAAYRIFSWDEVDVSIQNACLQKEMVIGGELQPILLEAMRLKDEHQEKNAVPDDALLLEEIELIEVSPDDDAITENRLKRVRDGLASALGDNAGVKRIVEDASLAPLVKYAQNLGSFLSLGSFNAGYLTREGGSGTAILPGQPPIAVEVAERCPRDRLMRALRGMNQ